MLIVLAILGLLAALVVPRLGGKVQEAQVQTTVTQINSLAGSVEQFAIDMGRYPSTDEGLEALVTRPATAADDRWKGPYLSKGFVPEDAWGRAFVYELENGRFIIRSLGADGQPGGEGYDADLDNVSR